MISKQKTVIIYASQTGQAKAIAESINDLLIQHEFEPTVHCISEQGVAFNLNELEHPVVFISSTTGDGEPPETGLKLYNKLKRLAADRENNTANKIHLKNFNYALLGLGDSNYAQFCNGPKQFHKKFQELGAHCFYGPFWADDGVGLELEVEPFKDGLVEALNKFFASSAAIASSESAPPPVAVNDHDDELAQKLNELKLSAIQNEELASMELNVPILADLNFSIEYQPIIDQKKSDDIMQTTLNKIFGKSNLMKARVTENKVITSKDAVKECYDLKFVCNDDPTIKYEPGYSIDIVAPNDMTEVQLLLKRLGIDDDLADRNYFRLKCKDEAKKTGLNFAKITSTVDLTLRTFFTYCVNIRNDSLKKALLRMLADYCTEKKEERRLLELCSREGSDQYQSVIKDPSAQMSLLDLLNLFESCRPPIEFLIQLLSPLNCRPYTLCSSSSSSSTGDEMEIVFNLVQFDDSKYNKAFYERYGVATRYLSQLNLNDEFYFSWRSIQTFTLPDDFLNRNILMFGPGTGVAPFIGFLRHKKQQKSANESNSNASGYWWLFYGCRDPNKDFLFKQELCNDLAPYLAKMSVCYSRFKSDKDKDQHQGGDDDYGNCKYVMDLIRLHKKEIGKLICNEQAMVYVCGDANNMSKDIFNALTECLTSFTEVEAKAYLFEMMKTKRFRQEIWA